MTPTNVVPITTQRNTKTSHFDLWTLIGYRDAIIPVNPGDKQCFEKGWPQRDFSDEEVAQWGASGKSVGIRLGEGLVCLDIDIETVSDSRAIRKIIDTVLGRSAVRYRKADTSQGETQSGRCALLFRVTEDIRKTVVDVSGGQLEILGLGQQVVVSGQHKSGQQYMWRDINGENVPPGRDGLTEITPDQLDALIAQVNLSLSAVLVKRAAALSTQVGSYVDGLDDPIWLTLNKLGLLEDGELNSRGFYEMTECPWADNHSDGVRSGGAYKNPNLFSCWHAHCNHKTFDDFVTWLDDTHPGELGKFQAVQEFGDAGAACTASGDIDMTQWDGLACVIEMQQIGADRAAEKESYDPDKNSSVAGGAIGLELVPGADLQARVVPERKWIVPGWVPAAEVTSWYGMGGTGKSLLAQQLGISRALGVDFMGMDVGQGRTLLFSCEDDLDELARRQCQILDAPEYGSGFQTLNDDAFVVAPRRGAEINLLMTYDNGVGQVTQVWEAVKQAVLDHKSDLLIIDTNADAYPGNENDRAAVNQFVKSCVGRLVAETGVAVLLLAHPSLTGNASGSGMSGSTAWDGAVRSRCVLRLPENSDETTDLRVLTKKKANYSGRGDQIFMQWEEGRFVCTRSVDGSVDVATGRPVVEVEAEVEFLRCLALSVTTKTTLSTAANATGYYVKWMLKQDGMEFLTKKELENALDRLVDAGVVGKRVELSWKGSSRGHKNYGIGLLPVSQGAGAGGHTVSAGQDFGDPEEITFTGEPEGHFVISASDDNKALPEPQADCDPFS